MLSVVTDDLPCVLLLPYLYRDARPHVARAGRQHRGEFLQDFTAQGRVGLSFRYDAGARSFLCPNQPVRSLNGYRGKTIAYRKLRGS